MNLVNKSITSIFLKTLLAGMVFLLSGCFKDFKEDYLFTDFMVEFDAATWESRAPGKTYPVLGPVEKGSGIYQYQINLLGEQRSVAQEIRYRVDLNESTAVEGEHFRLVDEGRVTMAANESTAFVTIEILDFPAESGVDTLVLELVGDDNVKVSHNYRQLGIAILLTGPPSETHPLYDQLGPANYYNSIYVDPQNLDIPADVAQRIDQSNQNLMSVGDGSRVLQNFYLYFNEDNIVNVVAQYNGGGGNSLTANAYAIWNYEFVPDAQGHGEFVFIDANGNGNSQKNNFAPLLADYLETYTFKVDWVTTGASTSAVHKEQWGGIFRVDDPSSYLMGSLETLSPTGSIRPFPQAETVHDAFTDGAGGYYSGLYVDPADPAQSPAFQQRWEDARDYVLGLGAGRELHKLLLYFNPSNNFQDVRVITYYTSSTGGRFLGQVRSQFKVSTDGTVQPFAFTFQNGNGNVTRSPEMFEDFFLSKKFTMTRTGNRVRFTRVDDPSEYFEGVLGDYPLSVSEFWPE